MKGLTLPPELVTNAHRIEQIKARDKAITTRTSIMDAEYSKLEEEQGKNVKELAELVRRNDQLSRL